MEPRLTFVTIGAKDLNAMEQFYREKFGWERTNEEKEVVFLKLNGIILGLYGRESLAEDANVSPEGSGFKGITFSINFNSEEEVDRVMADLESKGVKVTQPAEKVFWGGYRGYVSDIEDNLWEIAYNPFLEMDENGNVL